MNRYFINADGDSWKWDGQRMSVNGLRADSVFKSPRELLACMDVQEVGPPPATAEDIAAEKGDREQQREADDS